MKNLLYVGIAAALIAIGLLAALNNKKGPRTSREQPRRKRPLTENEQAMHNRLMQSLPDLLVLAQVSFGALLTARTHAARNTFAQKMADFVICDKAFQVLAIVELDDSTHRGKENRDAARDKLLTQAGYRVLRYPRIPDIERIRADFAQTKNSSKT